MGWSIDDFYLLIPHEYSERWIFLILLYNMHHHDNRLYYTAKRLIWSEKYQLIEQLIAHFSRTSIELWLRILISIYFIHFQPLILNKNVCMQWYNINIFNVTWPHPLYLWFECLYKFSYSEEWTINYNTVLNHLKQIKFFCCLLSHNHPKK